MKRFRLKLYLIAALGIFAVENNIYGTIKDSTSPTDSYNKLSSIQKYLGVFYPIEAGAEYTVTVCADLPVNNNPKCVYKKGEPGHVFLILSKTDSSTRKVITRSFGFYPRLPASCLVKQVRSKIMDNSNREYNASVEKKLSVEEFELLLDRCIEYAKKKYNLKKYNCYDYVLEVFNALPGIEKLPVSKVKFPFILGRGGSPCGFYKDLQKLVAAGSAWAPFIRFGVFQSPVTHSTENLIASY